MRCKWVYIPFIYKWWYEIWKNFPSWFITVCKDRTIKINPPVIKIHALPAHDKSIAVTRGPVIFPDCCIMAFIPNMRPRNSGAQCSAITAFKEGIVPIRNNPSTNCKNPNIHTELVNPWKNMAVPLKKSVMAIVQKYPCIWPLRPQKAELSAPAAPPSPKIIPVFNSTASRL